MAIDDFEFDNPPPPEETPEEPSAEEQEPAKQEEDLEEEMVEVLVRKRVSLKLKDAKGVTKQFWLIGMNGTERENYIDSMQKRVKMNKKGDVIGMSTMVGVHADLIGRHMQDDQGKKVPPSFINSLPADVQARIARRCRKISGLDEEAQEAAKNA